MTLAAATVARCGKAWAAVAVAFLLVLAVPAPAFASHKKLTAVDTTAKSLTLGDSVTYTVTVGAVLAGESTLTDGRESLTFRYSIDRTPTSTQSMFRGVQFECNGGGWPSGYASSGSSTNWPSTFDVGNACAVGQETTRTRVAVGSTSSDVNMRYFVWSVGAAGTSSGTSDTVEDGKTGSTSDGCWFLGCIWNWIKNVPSMVAGWFQPSDATKAEFATFTDGAADKVPFSFVTQPLDWADKVAGAPCDTCGGAVNEKFSVDIPNPMGNAWRVDVGSADHAVVAYVRPIAGALIYGGMLLGLAMWAFRRYAPAGGGE